MRSNDDTKKNTVENIVINIKFNHDTGTGMSVPSFFLHLFSTGLYIIDLCLRLRKSSINKTVLMIQEKNYRTNGNSIFDRKPSFFLESYVSRVQKNTIENLLMAFSMMLRFFDLILTIFFDQLC